MIPIFEDRLPEEQPPTEDRPLAEWLTRLVILINGAFGAISDALQNNIRILHELDFTAYDETDQVPLALDTPLQITFGAAQSSLLVDLAADGTITFTNPTLRSFSVELFLSVGRVGNPQTSYLYMYTEFNGVINPYPTVVSLFNSSEYKPLHVTVVNNYIAGDTVKMFIVRDSQGNDDGGLYTFDPVLAGIESTHSAKIDISHNRLDLS